MKWLTRMFTLPRRYNSLSDIARDPLGAIGNAAQWAVPLAMGLPGGFSSLGKALSNPALLGKWSLGNVGANFAALGGSKGLKGLSLGKLTTRDLLLGVGGLTLLQGQRRADQAASALERQSDLLGQIARMQLPQAAALSALQLGALSQLPTREQYEAQLRNALDRALQQIERSEAMRGVRTLSAEQRRAEAANRYAQAAANYPLELTRLVYGLPSAQMLAPLGMQTQLLMGRYADATNQLTGLASAIASLYPYMWGQNA